ncbi:hypothetical Protein YC6258_01494 [Gynuella sunshinyii YC6258]|uniref:Uncharacterized protein n=1 Tax=Gynuella sunshinyii YC6258 TaxID=1445510 RepID=A0A0C5VG08_9GAMM|nr:hypothetical Protein YC6258_01494 [Gynuella sunshinyii YC6258]
MSALIDYPGVGFYSTAGLLWFRFCSRNCKHDSPMRLEQKKFHEQH